MSLAEALPARKAGHLVGFIGTNASANIFGKYSSKIVDR
jgi:hypothetical protein